MSDNKKINEDDLKVLHLVHTNQKFPKEVLLSKWALV